mmetsp:Transcript_5102/g.8859  ORF Transcript_5102/g.8859 Transcript_5102/m.8859 type:complete len:356 (+) Transcript_5102:108-1175(+)
MSSSVFSANCAPVKCHWRLQQVVRDAKARHEGERQAALLGHKRGKHAVNALAQGGRILAIHRPCRQVEGSLLLHACHAIQRRQQAQHRAQGCGLRTCARLCKVIGTESLGVRPTHVHCHIHVGLKHSCSCCLCRFLGGAALGSNGHGPCHLLRQRVLPEAEQSGQMAQGEGSGGGRGHPRQGTDGRGTGQCAIVQAGARHLLHHHGVGTLKRDIHIHVIGQLPDLVDGEEAHATTTLATRLQCLHPAPGGRSLETTAQHVDGLALAGVLASHHLLQCALCNLQGVGVRQGGQQRPLMGQVLHHHLVAELGAIQRVADGNGECNLLTVHATLANQHATRGQAAHSGTKARGDSGQG